MKKLIYILLGFCSCFFGCKKEVSIPFEYTASIAVFNAIPTFDLDVKANFTGGQISYQGARPLAYYSWDGYFANGAVVMGLPVGKSVPLIVVKAADSTKQLFNQQVAVGENDCYSLFLTGTESSPEGLLLKEHPAARPDSTTGVRFINLSPDAGPLSINLMGAALGSELQELGYKSVSPYKGYPAGYRDNLYVFEIRDARSGDVLLTHYYFNLARKRNVTFIIRGLRNGFPGLEVVRFNN